MKRFLYYLSERMYGIFSTLFFLDLLGMGILYCLDVKYDMFFRDLFFLLLGLWIGSGIALFAVSYKKKNIS